MENQREFEELIVKSIRETHSQTLYKASLSVDNPDVHWRTKRTFRYILGKVIKEVIVDKDVLWLLFADGFAVMVYDKLGAYLSLPTKWSSVPPFPIEKDLSRFVGSRLHSIELYDMRELVEPSPDSRHYIQLFILTTNKGAFTIVFHRENCNRISFVYFNLFPMPDCDLRIAVKTYGGFKNWMRYWLRMVL